MTTALITHPDCLAHITPNGHPERVARLEAVLAALDSPAFDTLMRVEAPLGTAEQVALAHPPAHFDAVAAAIPDSGSRPLDADTHVSPGSLTAALRCVGGIVKAVDMVMAGHVANAFCATRPPGHHAERETPMGFCLFGHMAIAAKHAIAHHGLNRVAIVDFDVHHGNGTQDLIWDDPGILFISSHQMPLYPGTGAAHETGSQNNVLNIPLNPHADGAALLAAYDRMVLPALRKFEPELILISAGFDAHQDDPLANLNFSTQDFAEATRKLTDAASELCAGRVVSTLEGGYDLDALAASATAHCKVLMEAGA